MMLFFMLQVCTDWLRVYPLLSDIDPEKKNVVDWMMEG